LKNLSKLNCRSLKGGIKRRCKMRFRCGNVDGEQLKVKMLKIKV
jgi:hypothetical protein